MSIIGEYLQHFWPVLILIGIAIALTIVVFRRRMFERGPREGEAKDPAQVRRDNPPDRWSRSH